jgi:hypothetical protein
MLSRLAELGRDAAMGAIPPVAICAPTTGTRPTQEFYGAVSRKPRNVFERPAAWQAEHRQVTWNRLAKLVLDSVLFKTSPAREF